MTGWKEKLQSSALKAGNVACVGFDPTPEAVPALSEGNVRKALKEFFSPILDMMEEGLLPAAFKPNLGYFSALDKPLKGSFEGSLALADLLGELRKRFPEIPVILDSKRGDIARSSQNYAEEAFDSWEADAITVSPYMGRDSVEPFIRDGKGVFVLDRTSNKGGADLQNLVSDSGRTFYMEVAGKVVEWGTGAVVGATNIHEFKELSAFFAPKNVPLLIPGVGSQGGSAEEVMAALKDAMYDLTLVRINSSSSITHPWKKPPFPADLNEMRRKNLAALLEATKIG